MAPRVSADPGLGGDLSVSASRSAKGSGSF